MQAGAVLLAKYAAETPGGVPVVTRMNNVKFQDDGPAGRHDRAGSRAQGPAQRTRSS